MEKGKNVFFFVRYFLYKYLIIKLSYYVFYLLEFYCYKKELV